MSRHKALSSSVLEKLHCARYVFITDKLIYVWHGGAFISIYNHRGDDCDFLPPDPDVEWSIERIEKAIAKHMEQEIFYGKTHKDCKKAD